MSLDASEIGGHKHVGPVGGVLGFQSHLLKDRGNRSSERVLGNSDLVFFRDFESIKHACLRSLLVHAALQTPEHSNLTQMLNLLLDQLTKHSLNRELREPVVGC